MESPEITKITVEVDINASVELVWACFNTPEHVVKWNAASDDWHTPKASNDLRVGGQFNNRMEAKDGSFGFDFIGIYSEVIENQKISYAMEDGRTVDIFFEANGDGTHLKEIFVAETENSVELQKEGWQAILDNFKKHVESL
ncbi:MAG: polyketide cyclase [Cytophagaceae bacterium BCCC1]|nr:MAG: polyketide cyclase [Cytophagaceae bacterium BCCC1]OYU65455.1 MAG: polyketide cyclase [Cytophagaceae bacterium BCCC1]